MLMMTISAKNCPVSMWSAVSIDGWLADACDADDTWPDDDRVLDDALDDPWEAEEILSDAWEAEELSNDAWEAEELLDEAEEIACNSR